MLHLKGSVVVKQSSRTVKADELWVDTKARSGRSEGFLLVEDEQSAIASESGGSYDFESGEGRLNRTSAGAGDWRIHAKQARMSGRKRLDYLGADLTSCDLTPPHYRLHASRITVKPKKSLVVWNSVFFLGPVPLMYIPWFYRDLSPEHLVRMKFQPGYDRRNGAYLKGTLFTQHGPYAYSKVYLDYYSAQGVGTGVELERKKLLDRGVLFAYRIRENSSGTERWALLGNFYQTLVSSFSAQGRLQTQSDADFNNHYVRSSNFRVTPELINNGAIVYRDKVLTTRLSYSRHDTFMPDRINRFKDAESYPRIDVQTTQLKIWRLPWLNTFSGFADNTYQRDRPFLQRSVNGAWEGTRTFYVAKGLSFTPKLQYSETYYDKAQVAVSGGSRTLTDAAIGRYATENTLRWSTRLGDWDLTHGYARRLSPNTFSVDSGAADRGVESNLLGLREAYRPSRAVLVRAFSAYDFRTFRDRSVGFRERVQPIVGEVVYSPRPTYNVTLRDDYQLQEGNRSFIATFLYGDESATFFSLGAGHNMASRDRYQLDTQFAVANASQTLRVGAALRSVVGTTGGFGGVAADRFKLYEKEISVARAWHDFFTRLLVRFRPGGVREGQIRVDLRFGGKGPRRDTPPRRDWESEWFPERSSGVHDRP